MDVEQIAQELGLDVQTTQELVDEFLDELVHDVEELSVAIEDSLYQDIEDKAHYIKGVASNLRFKTMVDILFSLEEAANSKNKNFKTI